MALKTVQVSSNLARPGGSYGFSPSSPPSYCKPNKTLPLRRPADSTISAKNQHQKRSTSSVLKCRANLHGCTDEIVHSNNEQQATEIPVVLCPSSVTFPGATLQLQAFEFRYRIMVQTLLRQPAGLNNISFGVVYCPTTGGSMADVGCIVRVVECERLVDGRFFLTCVAGDRFRVLDVVRTKPYVVARVQVLRDRAGSEHDVDVGGLVRQVEQHLRNVAALSEKLGWDDRHRHHHHQLRRVQSAASFSFLVARLFVEDDRLEQQALLQTDDTAQRLAREGRYLERRSKYLAAIAAIKDAFQHLSCNEK